MGVEDTIMRVRQVIDDCRTSVSSAARGMGLNPNSLNRLWDDSWRPRADTVRKMERWLAEADGERPLSELPLSGIGWRIERDAEGWYILYEDPGEPYAIGPYVRLRDAVTAAEKERERNPWSS